MSGCPSVVSAIYNALDHGLNKEALKLTTAATKKFPNVPLLVALHAVALDRNGQSAVDTALALISDSKVNGDCVYPISLVLRKSPSSFEALAEFLEQQPGPEHVSTAIALRLLGVSSLELFPTSVVQTAALKGARENPELLKVLVLADAIKSDAKSKLLASASAKKIGSDFEVERVVKSLLTAESREDVISPSLDEASSITKALASNAGFAHLRALLAELLDTQPLEADKYLPQDSNNVNMAMLRSAWDLPVTLPSSDSEWSVLAALEKVRAQDVSGAMDSLYRLADESKTAKILLVALLSWTGADSEAEKKLKELKLQNAQWRTLTYLIKRPNEKVQAEIQKYMGVWIGDLVEATKQLVEAGKLDEVHLYKKALHLAQTSWSLVRVKLCALEDALIEGHLKADVVPSTLAMVAKISPRDIFDDRDFAPFNPVSRGPKRSAHWFFTKRFVSDDLAPRLALAKGLHGAIAGLQAEDDLLPPAIAALFRSLRMSDAALTDAADKLQRVSDYEVPYIFACLTLLGDRIPKKNALRASKEGAFRKLCAAVALLELEELPEVSFCAEAAKKSRDDTQKRRDARLAKVKLLAKTLTR